MTAHIEREVRRLDSVACVTGNSQPELLADIKELRTVFVEAMGWPCAEDGDHDIYDERGDTMHLMFRHGERLLAGMRLTPVSTPEQSLSLEMMSNNQTMSDDVRRALAVMGNDCVFYDLTRLVALPELSSRDDVRLIKAGMAQMFGLGFERTYYPQAPEKVRWIYATTTDMARTLASMGIRQEVLAEGCVSDEDTQAHAKTLFCTTSPWEAYSGLCANPSRNETLRNVNIGLGQRYSL